MGGKKKKGISNKLAKMSDEERARYLQHRAAIEEEAKRRKEQLISTYMKNKLRKEEAFTRLNVAKINEHWHQIMRKIKVKELKVEIIDMKIWITKILEIKNSIIERLLIEIEEGEEQYEMNLTSHLQHLNKFIDIHHERQEYWEKNYEQYRNQILFDAHKELKDLTDEANKQEIFLKTALFGLEKDYNDFVKEMKEFRSSKLEDDSNTNRADHEAMVKSYALKMQKIWKEINVLLKDYLIRTTQKRHHYIEMRHIDERNEATRMRNERRIAKLTETFTTLKHEYDTIYETNEEQIRELTDLRENTNLEFQKLKRNLTSEIRQDEKILKTMTIASNSSIKKLERILEKGNSLTNFLTVCEKLETPEQKLNKWAKFQGNLEKLISQLPEQDISSEIDSTPEKYSTLEKDSTFDRGSSERDSTSEKDTSSNKSSSERSKSLKGKSSSSSNISGHAKHSETFPDELEFLTKMEGIWFNCNSAEIETAELKKEKSILLAENKNMKQIIKGILRDAALETPPPKEICFPVVSRIQSAPVQSHKINLQGLDFLVIDL